MSLLKPVSDGGAFLKVGVLGFAGSGKTHTAALLAIGARKFFDLSGPIAFFDTENSTPYIAARVKQETGADLFAVKSRSLDDLKATVKECVEARVSVLIVDSVTHVWREVCDTYLARLNASRKANRLQTLDRLEFQHWGALKSPEMWGGWTDLLLNSPLHVIVCGRAGYEYDFEEDERGKKQLVKTGVKMKAEGEFGYEPSLVVEMTAVQIMDGDDVTRIDHEALILKDRFDVMNGKTFTNPTFDSFLPHVERLRPAQAAPVDTSRKTEIAVDESGNANWQRERRAREIVLENVASALDAAGLGGTSNEAKQSRARLLVECFGTGSKTELEGMRSEALRDGLAKLSVRLDEIAQAKKETKA